MGKRKTPFCDLFALHKWNWKIKQIAKYLLMDHSIQKCILHVFAEHNTTVDVKNKFVFSLLLQLIAAEVVDIDMRARFFPARSF